MSHSIKASDAAIAPSQAELDARAELEVKASLWDEVRLICVPHGAGVDKPITEWLSERLAASSQARAKPTLQQVSDYLHALDDIERGLIECEARALPPSQAISVDGSADLPPLVEASAQSTLTEKVIDTLKSLGAPGMMISGQRALDAINALLEAAEAEKAAAVDDNVPTFEARHVSLKQRGQACILTLELNGVEGAPRYLVTPINPAVVREPMPATPEKV